MTDLNLSTAVGGLNISDPLDNMEPQYAIQMDNVIPEPDKDSVRSGFIQKYVSAQAYSKVLPINIGDTKRLFVARSGDVDIFDIDDFTAPVGTKSGFTSSDWLQTQFTDGAGKVYVMFANGQDTPQQYTVSAGLEDVGYTLTGFPHLSCPMSFKNRMYYISGDFEIAYSGLQAISGSLTKFGVGSFFKKGGKLLTMCNWTQDAGNGVDDLFVLVSTEGEVMIYSGDDPEADNWQTLGVFQIPKPIGKKCTCMFGADIIVITEKGYFPLSNVLSNIRANRAGISQKIDGITKGRDLTRSWEVHFFPKQNWLLVNAPSLLAGYTHEQHVLNVATNGWCRFVGMDAESWCEIDGRLFFCNGKGVFEADVGTTDNGEPIVFSLQRAYSQFGTPYKKQLMRMVPRYYAESSTDFSLYKKINVDFSDAKYKTLDVKMQQGYSSFWDEAIWDENFWSDEFSAYSFRGAVSSKVGNFISVGYYGRTTKGLSFYSCGLMIKNGRGHI